MFLGKVVGNADSESHTEVPHHGLKIVQKLDLYRNPCGHSAIAINFIGAKDGDIVIVGTSNLPAGNAISHSSAVTDSTILGILDKHEASPESRYPSS